MAVADLDAWKAALGDNAVRPNWLAAHTNNNLFGPATFPFLPTAWTNRNGTPSTPSTAIAPDSTYALATIPPPPDDDYWIGAIECGLGNASNAARAGGMLVDILSIQGGLSGTTTGAQTTNLPTAALTRYTDGEGVMMAIIIWSGVGSTTTSAFVSYTNTAGTSGRTSQEIVLGSSGTRSFACFLTLPTQAGDTGAKSIESLEILASTGTAGSFGVCLYKPLVMLPAQSPIITQREPYRNYLEAAASVSPDPDACLATVLFGIGGGTGAMMAGGSIVYVPG